MSQPRATARHGNLEEVEMESRRPWGAWDLPGGLSQSARLPGKERPAIETKKADVMIGLPTSANDDLAAAAESAARARNQQSTKQSPRTALHHRNLISPNTDAHALLSTRVPFNRARSLQLGVFLNSEFFPPWY